MKPSLNLAVQKVAYSAFYQTQLEWVLRKVGVDLVIFVGIVTNGGVASTVRDAHMRDFETYVVSDCCAAFTTEKHDTALADMANVATVSTIEALCGVSL